MAQGDLLCVIPAPLMLVTGSVDPIPNKRKNIPVWEYDDTATENLWALIYLPSHYSGGGITATFVWMAKTATTGTARWQAGFTRMQDDAVDLDGVGAPSTVKAITATVPNVSGEWAYDDMTFLNSEIDGLLAGECAIMLLQQNGGVGTMTGKAQLIKVVLTET